MTLLEYLRQSRCVGTKEGCGDGDCGACTVVVVGKDATGEAQYQAVNSCLIPVASVAGREIITVEGVANGQLHPVQAALVETGGSQCGYCTPGIVMSLFAGYHSGELDDGCVEGNLCRCTGYLPIRRAAQQLVEQEGEKAVLQPPEWTELAYEGKNGVFYRPPALEEVLALLQQHPEAVLVAGATDLGLELSQHTRPFPVMISLEAVAEMLEIHQIETGVEIGAAVPLRQIEKQLPGIFPSLDAMLHLFASRQIRNRATIGGSLATASPIGDLAPVFLALDGTLKLRSSQGERIVPISEFFTGYRQTILQKGEVIVSVELPTGLSSGAVKRLNRSYKICKRGTDDISTVAAAFTVELDAANQIIQARLAYGGVAATPIRAIAIENALIGKSWTWETIQEIKPLLRETFQPLSDLRGSAEYRKLLIGNLFEKFFVNCSC